MPKDLLFEIGVEELPAPYIPPALRKLEGALRDGLTNARLGFSDVSIYATPRRLACVASGISDSQPDVEREAVGPPAAVGFSDDGSPTKAATGFAKSQGVDISDLKLKGTDRGDYVVATVVDRGRAAEEVVPEVLGAVVRSLEFPKTMRWGPEERFARPIRWLVAMLGGETLGFSYAGVSARPETYGHRFYAPGPHPLKGAEDYLDVLEGAFVIADIDRRMATIVSSAERLAAEAGGSPVPDEDLLTTVTFMVEYPMPFLGRFDERFLKLPRDVVVAAMKGHQRYFAVEAGDSLLPSFICVANCLAEHVDRVREGNERVLVSRLDDAEFYWVEDTRSPLESKVESLKNVVWLEGLGSLYEKTERISALAAYLGGRLGSGETDHAVRAARLAKADLVTEMVRDGKEFTELQGLMGREYALVSSEPTTVAVAIYEHYLPKFAGDDLPTTEAGIILSIADKIDSIAGCFSAGLVPTGSQDPYALRRQAIGITRLVLEKNLILSVEDLVSTAVRGHGLDGEAGSECTGAVLGFLKQRARTVFMDRGFAYDLVDAVLEASFDDLVGAASRLEALSHFRQTEDFVGLVIGAKRATNILKGISRAELPSPVPEDRLSEDEELSLLAAARETSLAVDEAIRADDLDRAVRELLTLRKPIDDFFDHVMVMVEEDSLRTARLSLLDEVRSLFLRVCDFSRVVLEGEEA